MSDGAQDRARQSTETAIANSKLELDAAVAAYSGVHQAGDAGDVEAMRVQLHRAVVGLWWRMRPALLDEDVEGWEDVSEADDWEGDVIWSGRHPKTGDHVKLQGLRDLREWIDRQADVRRTRTGPKLGGTTVSESVPLRLPGQAALRSAELLTQQFREFGWGAAIDSTARTEISDDLLEEVEQWRQETLE